jgi:hypothetical protein
MNQKFFKYGIKHEVAVNWPIWDLKKSRIVAEKINIEIADKIILNLLVQGKPGLVGRLGGTEARFLKEFKKIKSLKFGSDIVFKIKPNWYKRSKQINSLAGFYFENIREAQKFYDIYWEAMSQTDVLGAWGTTFGSIEADFLDKIETFIPKESTAPWVFPYSRNAKNIPWSTGLQHKKILVISMFTETIQKQFAKIDKVFPEMNYHNFNLITLKSPFTANTKYPVTRSWFEHLEALQKQMKNIDFDIALISAGSYSYPLAHFAKQIGRIGIHSGGGLQLFFGVMGKRWEESEYVIKVANSQWTRAIKSETPDSASSLENGAYW